MKLYAIGAFVFLFQHFSLAYAQKEAADKAQSSTSISSPIPPGVYRGEVIQTGGSMRSDGRPRSSKFELDLTRSPGTLAMDRAASPCDSAMPIVVTSIKESVVRLEQNIAHGGFSGCERVFDLTVSGNDLVGSLISPNGRTYSVKATKQ